jgi:hypothetical protein
MDDPRARPSVTVRGYAAVLGVILLAAVVELAMGRPALGPGGFGVWVWDIWSANNSQFILDPYSFSHLVHGFLFFAILGLASRRLSLEQRLLIAALLEAAWEVLENSPIIINRYRQATIALGYEGDSILNSVSDLVMMSLGFLAASRLKAWQSVAAVVVMELGCLLLWRDNLTLNVIMLIYPIDAIKSWQMAGRPLI